MNNGLTNSCLDPAILRFISHDAAIEKWMEKNIKQTDYYQFDWIANDYIFAGAILTYPDGSTVTI